MDFKLTEVQLLSGILFNSVPMKIRLYPFRKILTTTEAYSVQKYISFSSLFGASNFPVSITSCNILIYAFA